ncbi:hypothetical protein AZ78_5269 [Lysobacter capsici AZ78]|uniref:Uncharacterized protein n=1 Tax=Lysobacter capsici AZ78 TaxID=1444315 RepID=A0A125TZQ2_9GAMM|nr:hypothetical protein AZ78_5269 [Lysobacter capsici AZ78]
MACIGLAACHVCNCIAARAGAARAATAGMRSRRNLRRRRIGAVAACAAPTGRPCKFGSCLKPRSSSSAAKLGTRENNSTPVGRRTWMCAVRHRDRMSRVAHARVSNDLAGT